MIHTVDVLIVGAGHSGLAMSRFLSQGSIDHVVLERGEVANSWRQRWDSLRLLTPNWQSRLPGYRYSGTDPNGFMTAREVARFIDTYASSINAPVRTGTAVISVTAAQDGGYRVVTNRGRWQCRAVVIASGAHNIPALPPMSAAVPSSIRTLTPKEYRNPAHLDARGVLVVGASATGVQLADEIQRSGRQVTLAVGEHIRMPRVYRGLDIQWWLDAMGVLDERYDEVDDIVRARRVPSPQLVGTPERATIDINALTSRGVEVVGRLVGLQDGKAQFSGSLRNHCAMADLKLTRLLERIDTWARMYRPGIGLGEPQRYETTRVDDKPRLSLDLGHSNIGTIVWASGFRPDYEWLHVPALDRKGLLRHEGGVVCVPGLYVLGLNFMRRRKSSFMHGAEDDVRDLGAHLTTYLHAGGSAFANRSISTNAASARHARETANLR